MPSLAEARTLREAGFTENPILMLRGSADPQEVEELLKLGVTLSLGSREDYFTLKRTAERLDVVADVHLELDTGMGRYGYSTDRLNMKWLLGFYWEGENPHIHPTGIYTHFHTAGDRGTTKRQYREFRKVIDFLQETKCDVGMIHCCNSTAFWYYPEYHEDAVRLGSAILGRVYWAREAGLRRVGWVEAPIQEIHYLPEGGNVGYGSACIAPRRTELAVVGVGYYHGFAVERGYDVFRPQDCIRGDAPVPEVPRHPAPPPGGGWGPDLPGDGACGNAESGGECHRHAVPGPGDPGADSGEPSGP